MNRIALFVSAAALVFGAQAEPVFQPASAYNPAQLLPAPHADGSAESRAELKELQTIEGERSPAAYAHALSDGKTKDVSAFADVMGPGFDVKTLPKTAALFADVRQEENSAAKLAKAYFHRNRPWIADPALKSCPHGDDEPQSSYPSGHATMGYSFAVVLAALAPEKAPAILTRAADYAHSRLVCGMHYRSDIVAGQALGTAVAAELFAVPKFKAEFEAARAELQAARLTH